MKLLLDNNLSHKFCMPLQQYFDEVTHVRNVLYTTANDFEIWNYAMANNFIFLQRIMILKSSLLKGCPPKIIHLLCGNQTTLYILNLVLKNRKIIEGFINQSSEECILKLYV